MNKKQARDWARQTYGPDASVIHVSSKDRNQRHGIMFLKRAGPYSNPEFYCLGFGADWDDAVKMCKENPVAVEFAKQWGSLLDEFDKFNRDPEAYLEERKKEVAEVLKENENNG